MTERRECLELPDYLVGSDGSIWSKKWGKLRKLPTSVTAKGYLRVSLSVDGKTFERKVHHLVLEAFIGPRPAGCECRHLDGDKKNNRPENLCWGTSEENAADRIRHGTSTRVGTGATGEANGNCKIGDDGLAEVKRLAAAGVSQVAIGKRLGISGQHVGRILKGQQRSSEVCTAKPRQERGPA